VLELQALPTDRRFARNTDRVRERIALSAALAPSFNLRPRGPILNALIEAGVPAGAVRSIDEVMSTPAARAMVLEENIDGVVTRRIRGNAFRVIPN
jgi:crotonobetainyl-CoA:carnitine CoA-transferase CaiB-like acyl-CoA transferase